MMWQGSCQGLCILSKAIFNCDELMSTTTTTTTATTTENSDVMTPKIAN